MFWCYCTRVCSQRRKFTSISTRRHFLIYQSLLLIIDLTFIHERPLAVALNWSLTPSFAYAIFSLAPEMCDAGTNYKLFYQIWLIPCLISIVLAILFVPETYFIRPAQSYLKFLECSAAEGGLRGNVFLDLG